MAQQQMLITLHVPPGARPGQVWPFCLPDDRRIELPIPDGLRPGDPFSAQVPYPPGAIPPSAPPTVPVAAVVAVAAPAVAVAAGAPARHRPPDIAPLPPRPKGDGFFGGKVVGVHWGKLVAVLVAVVAVIVVVVVVVAPGGGGGGGGGGGRAGYCKSQDTPCLASWSDPTLAGCETTQSGCTACDGGYHWCCTRDGCQDEGVGWCECHEGVADPPGAEDPASAAPGACLNAALSCLDAWSDDTLDGCDGVQRGCEAAACDGDPTPWCCVDEGCAGQDSGWCYCEPGTFAAVAEFVKVVDAACADGHVATTLQECERAANDLFPGGYKGVHVNLFPAETPFGCGYSETDVHFNPETDSTATSYPASWTEDRGSICRKPE